MRKEKWWSLLILPPVTALVSYQYVDYLRDTAFFFPQHLHTTAFCAASVISYPLCIFKNKRLKLAGLAVSLALVIAAIVLALSTGRMTYNTTVMVSGGSLNTEFDDTYSVRLEDEAYGEVTIVYDEHIESYKVNASFIKTGQTTLILSSPDGKNPDLRPCDQPGFVYGGRNHNRVEERSINSSPERGAVFSWNNTENGTCLGLNHEL